MYYEHFLFTRNTRRDFTAFIRPEEITNKDVSAIASIIGYINDVTWLTPEHPGLYCFSLGAYTYLVRHYDSGRRHAGRPIAVLEGVAVKRTRTRTFADYVATFIRQQHTLLNVSMLVQDIEMQQVETSTRFELANTQMLDTAPGANDTALIEAYAGSLTENRLLLPFTDIGLRVLLQALTAPTIPPLQRFAFGANSDVFKQFSEQQIDLDIVAYFNTTQPALRNRSTNELVLTFDGYPSSPFIPPQNMMNDVAPQDAMHLRDHSAPPTPRSRQQGETYTHIADSGEENLGVLTPRQLRQRARDMATANVPIDTEQDAQQAADKLFDGEVLTPREMRRRWIEEEAQRAAEEQDDKTSNWLVAIWRRLFGRG